jgi:hypothetical protein
MFQYRKDIENLCRLFVSKRDSGRFHGRLGPGSHWEEQGDDVGPVIGFVLKFIISQASGSLGIISYSNKDI